MTALKDAQVYTSDGKSAVKIARVNKEYFTFSNEGFVFDEEYRIPLDAISHIERQGTI
jgi:hypothetical protein